MTKQEIKEYQDYITELGFKRIKEKNDIHFQKVYSEYKEELEKTVYLGVRFTFGNKAFKYYQILSTGEIVLRFTAKLEDLKVKDNEIDMSSLKEFKGKRKRDFIRF